MNFFNPKSYDQFVEYFNELFFKFDGITNPIENSMHACKLFLPINDDCPICCLPYTKNRCIMFYCESEKRSCHLYHEGCLSKWTDKCRDCPICRLY